MAQIARMLRRAFQAPNMIDLVIKSFPTPLRAVGVHPLTLPKPPKRGRVQRPLRRLWAAWSVVDRPLRRVAEAHQAGELALAQRPHLRSRAGRVRTSPLATMKVTVRTAKRTVVNASLLPTTLPMAMGAAEVLVALAVALLAVQAALGETPTVGVATCPRINSGRRSLLNNW